MISHGGLIRAIFPPKRAKTSQALSSPKSDFTQTWKLDEWAAAGDVTFIFGVDAMPNLVELAAGIARVRLAAPGAAAPLQGEDRAEREKPENVKERIVREREYKNLVLQCEDVAEFEHRPATANRPTA